MHDDDQAEGLCVSEDVAEDRPLMAGHLLSGLTTLHSEGIETSDVFLCCDQLDHLAPERLRSLDETAYPSLRSCGRHNLEDH